MTPPKGIVVAIDAGTTGVRSFAIDEHGHPRGWSYREFTQHFPEPGRVEHDAAEIWSVVQETLAELAAEVDQPIAAIGITNQRETVVVWDRRTGKPLHRAIVWQDRRTAPRCDELHAAGHLDLVRAQTGLVLDPYFSATKLEWILRSGLIDAGADLAFGTIDSWVLWNLTGGAVHATDPSNASRTMLFDIGRLEWSADLLALFDVPRSCLPEVRPSSGRLGTTAAGVGVPAGIPISGIAGDQQAALFGQACFEPGMMKNTYGTGSFVLMNIGPDLPPPVDGLLTTVAWTLDDGTTAYTLEGAIFVTGAAVQWLRDGLGLIESAADIGPLAESCPDSEGVYVVPAFTGLGSPYWDPYARRHDHRHHTRHRPRAPGPGRRRGDDLPDARRGRGHGRCVRTGTGQRYASTEGPPSWICSCSCKRTSSVSPSHAPPCRRPPRSAPPTSRVSRKACGDRSTTSRHTGSWTGSSIPTPTSRAPISATPDGSEPSTAPAPGQPDHSLLRVLR